MEKIDVVKVQMLFESITCLAVEGPELHTKLELMKAIEKEAIKGYELCKRHLSEAPTRPDNIGVCPGCGSAGSIHDKFCTWAG